MNIDEITQWEAALQKRMPEHGFLEQRDEYLRKNGVYKEWQEVFSEYATLASSGNLEALKRSLFFIWYELDEPEELHGIRSLDEEQKHNVMQLLDHMCAKDELDTELKWMAAFYYHMTDYYLEGYCELKEVSKANRSIYIPDWEQHKCYKSFREMLKAEGRKINLYPWEELCLKSSFSGRGQMGCFWKAIQDNVAKELKRITNMTSLKRAKPMLGIVVFGLLVSGIAVWPAVAELKLAVCLAWGDSDPTGVLHTFVLQVIEGLESVQASYPFMLYAHDWLAFAHIVLAILFAGAIRDPVRNVWIVQSGLIMCALIPVLAGICVPLRGLPLCWFWVDCAFAPAAGLPLWIALKDIRRAESKLNYEKKADRDR